MLSEIFVKIFVNGMFFDELTQLPILVAISPFETGDGLIKLRQSQLSKEHFNVLEQILVLP